MNYSYSLGGTSAKGTGSTLGKRACQWAEVGIRWAASKQQGSSLWARMQGQALGGMSPGLKGQEP